MGLELNEEQLKPAKMLDGAVLVSAGAGSGKTRLLTQRIANIIDSGVKPWHILCITFTNKAAAEMRERLAQMDNVDVGKMWVMTFHAMCVRILREVGDIGEGWKDNFTIYAEVEKERVIKQILKSANLDADDYLKKLKSYISDSKQEIHLSAEEYLSSRFLPEEEVRSFANLMNKYAKTLQNNNAMDFDDLMINTYKALSNHSDILSKYRAKFQYISVDEFQDTNTLQYELIKLLGGRAKDEDNVTRGGNVFIVGDEDQSIYGWRGAKIANMQSFAKEFGATVFKLEQNYRSTKNILTAANKVINNNGERIKKTLWSNNPDGPRIDKYTAKNELEEAEYVARSILVLNKMGLQSSEIAIIMRLNALTRSFEERLMAYSIKYDVFGGFKFFERKEIKDLIAYLRVLVNPNDSEGLTRIINVPKRGIGDGALTQLRDFSMMYGVPMVTVAAEIDTNGIISTAVIKKVSPFGRLLRELMDLKDNVGLVELVNEVIERTNFLEQFSAETEENVSRRANIDQFVSSVQEFVKMNGQEATLSKYLESITLYSDTDEMDENKDSVTLATVHAVKGLEFRAVFIVGLEEGIFPLVRDSGDMEEERRLMYVAITRAKEKLFLTRSESRFLYGKRDYMTASRFLAESGYGDVSKIIKMSENRMGVGGDCRTSTSSAVGYGHANTGCGKVASSQAVVSQRQDVDLFAVGQKIRHPTFGVGEILSIDRMGTCAIAKMKFESVGQKSIVLGLVSIEIL